MREYRTSEECVSALLASKSMPQGKNYCPFVGSQLVKTVNELLGFNLIGFHVAIRKFEV